MFCGHWIIFSNLHTKGLKYTFWMSDNCPVNLFGRDLLGKMCTMIDIEESGCSISAIDCGLFPIQCTPETDEYFLWDLIEKNRKFGWKIPKKNASQVSDVFVSDDSTAAVVQLNSQQMQLWETGALHSVPQISLEASNRDWKELGLWARSRLDYTDQGNKLAIMDGCQKHVRLRGRE